MTESEYYSRKRHLAVSCRMTKKFGCFVLLHVSGNEDSNIVSTGAPILERHPQYESVCEAKINGMIQPQNISLSAEYRPLPNGRYKGVIVRSLIGRFSNDEFELYCQNERDTEDEALTDAKALLSKCDAPATGI